MRRPPIGSSRLVGCLAAAAMLLGACGDVTASDPAAASQAATDVDSGYVGTLDGTDAFIGLLVSGSNAAVYACDGDGKIAEYFWGPVTDSGTLALDSPTEASIHAELVDGTFTGTITLPGGTAHPFTTERAVGDAGTYLVVGEQAVAADVSAGWIIDNHGAERGALLKNGSFRSTPKFDRRGLVLDDDGFAMTRLVVNTDAEQQTSVTASEIVAPDNLVAPDNTDGPDNVLRVPSPAGPIPIPIPNENLTRSTDG